MKKEVVEEDKDPKQGDKQADSDDKQTDSGDKQADNAADGEEEKSTRLKMLSLRKLPLRLLKN